MFVPQILKADLELKRQTMDKLCSLVQDLLTNIKSKEAAGKLEAKLERFAQRWDKLVQSLHLTSTKVVMLMPFHLLRLIFSAILFHLFPFLSEFDMASCIAVPSLRINKVLSLYLTLFHMHSRIRLLYIYTCVLQLLSLLVFNYCHHIPVGAYAYNHGNCHQGDHEPEKGGEAY